MPTWCGFAGSRDMSHNIKNQLIWSAQTNFKEHINKHSLQHQGRTRDGSIKSYDTLQRQVDVAKQFGRWEMEHHPEIRRVVDIPTEHINEWLLEMASSGRWSDATATTTASAMRTMVDGIARTYGRAAAQADDVKNYHDMARQEKVRDKAVEAADRDALVRYAEEHQGRSRTLERAVELSVSAGLRAEGMHDLKGSDIDIHTETGTATVHLTGDKNGRCYPVEVTTQKGVEYLTKIKAEVGDGYIFPSPVNDGKPLRSESIERSIRRGMEAVGISDDYKDTTAHALRKEWAQNEYDNYRSTHTKQEAKEYVSIQLGHTDKRAKDLGLLRRYLERIW